MAGRIGPDMNKRLKFKYIFQATKTVYEMWLTCQKKKQNEHFINPKCSHSALRERWEEAITNEI